jgi:hypothetical protein
VDAAQFAFLLELLDFDGDAVGQLFAEVAEQLLAQDLGGEEALVAVGDVVGIEDGRAFGQVGTRGCQQGIRAEALFGRDRQDFGGSRAGPTASG